MLLALTIALVVCVIWYFASVYVFDEYPGDALLIGIVVAVLVIIVQAMTSVVISNDIEVEPTPHRLDVVALSDTTEIQGRFSGGMFVFVGSIGGSISERPVYLYYTRDSNGGIRQERTDVDDGVVYEDVETANNAYVQYYKCPKDKTVGSYWSLYTERYICDDDVEDVREIHVPPGTVVRSISLDMK